MEKVNLGKRKFRAGFFSVIGLLILVTVSSQLAAADWSTGVSLSPVVALGTPNAFAGDPAGNQVWITRKAVTGGYIVQAAQRPAGGSWSALTDISALLSSAPGLTAGISADGNAAAAWASLSDLQIVLYSPADGWQAPVIFPAGGSKLNLQLKLDGQGNGTAVWTRLTSNVAVVEAITWSRTGAFSTIRQLSPTSHGSFLPSLAVNKAGTAIVAWQAAGLLNNSNPYQVESVTRLPGGAWSTVTTVSPAVSQTWTPMAALDAAGNSTVIWEQGAAVNNYRIYAAVRPADGVWSNPVKIEQTTWYYAGSVAIASDDAGNITTAWVAENSTGSSLIRSALKSAGSPWQPAVTVGPATTIVNLVSVPQVAASSDGSLTVIGWASYGSANAPSVATRVKGGTWLHRTLSTGNAQRVYVLAGDNASASAFWPESTTGRHRVILMESDYR